MWAQSQKVNLLIKDDLVHVHYMSNAFDILRYLLEQMFPRSGMKCSSRALLTMPKPSIICVPDMASNSDGNSLLDSIMKTNVFLSGSMQVSISTEGIHAYILGAQNAYEKPDGTNGLFSIW